MRSAPIPVTRTLGQEQEEMMRTQLGGDKLDLCVTASLMTSDLSELLSKSNLFLNFAFQRAGRR